MALASVLGLAYDGHDLIHSRRVGRVPLTAVTWRYPGAWSPVNDADRQRPATTEKTTWLPPI
jgi:hypothetical protein